MTTAKTFKVKKGTWHTEAMCDVEMTVPVQDGLSLENLKMIFKDEEVSYYDKNTKMLVTISNHGDKDAPTVLSLLTRDIELHMIPNSFQIGSTTVDDEKRLGIKFDCGRCGDIVLNVAHNTEEDIDAYIEWSEEQHSKDWSKAGENDAIDTDDLKSLLKALKKSLKEDKAEVSDEEWERLFE